MTLLVIDIPSEAVPQGKRFVPMGCRVPPGSIPPQGNPETESQM